MLRKTLRKVSFTFISLVLVYSFAVLAAEEGKKTGSLNVIAESGEYAILLDNQSIGRTPVSLKGVQAGTHYLKAVSGEVSVEEEVIEIKTGEVTTVIISPRETVRKPEVKYVEEKKEEPKEPDYSERIFRGYYLVLGYAASSYPIYSPGYSYDDLTASSIGYGIGYKYGFFPYIDVALELTRADLSKGGISWFVMPLCLNLSYSGPNQGKGSKWYVGAGLSYIFTNLSVSGINLGGTGTNMYCGYELPVGKDAVFFDYGLDFGKNPTGGSNLLTYLRIGYRWNS